MKRMIDMKSLAIGILATVLFFTVIGAKSRNNINFNTITAKTIKIVNSEGKPVVFLSSYKGAGGLVINNKEGKTVALLSSYKGAGQLDINNKYGKKVATVQSNKDSDGEIFLFNRYGDSGWGMTGKR